MKSHVDRSPMLMAALVAAALAAHTSQATTLQAGVFGERSFWDASVWTPAQTPGPGDTIRIGNLGPRLYLGDFAAFAAQSRQISRLHFDATGALHVLNWGSKPAGGQAGGLSFSQDDPADFGVGIRVGRISGSRLTAIPVQRTTKRLVGRVFWIMRRFGCWNRFIIISIAVINNKLFR